MQATFGKLDLGQLTTIPTLIIGDLLKVIKEFPANSIDLIYADEAYNDLDEQRKIGTTTRLKESEGSQMKWYDTITYDEIIPEYSRVLKKGRHWYSWRPSLNGESWKNWDLLLSLQYGLISKNKFSLAKVLPAEKSWIGMGYTFRSTHECLMFCIKSLKDKVQLNDLSLPDILNEKWLSPRSGERIHDSEKPIEVARKVIECSSNPNEIVLDSFAGSFQAGQANVKYGLNRIVVGIEKNSKIAQRTIDHFRINGLSLNVMDCSDW